MLDRLHIEEVASALATEPGLIEKEWHVVRAIGAIAALDHGPARPVFSGGTSLSLAWGLIKRFSEDIARIQTHTTRSRDFGLTSAWK